MWKGMKRMLRCYPILITLLFVVSCHTTKGRVVNSVSKDSLPENAVCSVEDMRLVDMGRKYIYFDRDSLFLNLSPSEAAEKGISKEDYKRLSDKLRVMNLFLKETLDSLKPGKKLHFPIPKNRIQDSLNVSDKFDIELIDEIE